jgi:hypothetical protein
VVLLDAQPIHNQLRSTGWSTRRPGNLERGYVRIADMVTRQPWDDNLPVQVYRGDSVDAR